MSEAANRTDDKLWLRHRERLRTYIAQRVNETDSVDDILQDVFLKALSNVDVVRGNLGAWLYRIAANAVIDHYRSRRPHVELPEDLTAPEPDRMAERQLSHCLEPLIGALPETYREPLVLSELEGLPQKEVARRLGLSLSGAKSRVQRGRQKLYQRLLACCDVEVGRGGIVDYEPLRKGNCDGCD